MISNQLCLHYVNYCTYFLTLRLKEWIHLLFPIIVFLQAATWIITCFIMSWNAILKEKFNKSQWLLYQPGRRIQCTLYLYNYLAIKYCLLHVILHYMRNYSIIYLEIGAIKDVALFLYRQWNMGFENKYTIN
jgi:hypothetical protein